MKDVTNTGERQFVVFGLGSEEFGIEIARVKEIIKWRSLTKLPEVSAFVEGITSLRGQVIPVMSLSKKFGFSEADNDDAKRIIIVEFGTTLVGIIVDRVEEVLRISESVITPPPHSIAGINSSFIDGIGRIDERLLMILNIDRVFSGIELTEFEERAS